MRLLHGSRRFCKKALCLCGISTTRSSGTKNKPCLKNAEGRRSVIRKTCPWFFGFSHAEYEPWKALLTDRNSTDIHFARPKLFDFSACLSCRLAVLLFNVLLLGIGNTAAMGNEYASTPTYDNSNSSRSSVRSLDLWCLDGFLVFGLGCQQWKVS